MTQGHLLTPRLPLLTPFSHLWLPMLPCSLSSWFISHSCSLCMRRWGGKRLKPLSFQGLSFLQTQAYMLPGPVGSTPAPTSSPGLLCSLVLLDKLALAAPRGRDTWPQRCITAQQGQSFSLARRAVRSSDHPPLQGYPCHAGQALPQCWGACRGGGSLQSGSLAVCTALPPSTEDPPAPSLSPRPHSAEPRSGVGGGAGA